MTRLVNERIVTNSSAAEGCMPTCHPTNKLMIPIRQHIRSVWQKKKPGLTGSSWRIWSGCCPSPCAVAANHRARVGPNYSQHCSTARHSTYPKPVETSSKDKQSNMQIRLTVNMSSRKDSAISIFRVKRKGNWKDKSDRPKSFNTCKSFRTYILEQMCS